MEESEKTNNEPEVTILKDLNSPMSTPVAIVIAGVIIAVAIIFSGGSDNAPTDNRVAVEEEGLSDKEVRALAKITKDDHVRGNWKADIYVLEFSDTECPFCKQFHTTMQQIIEEYDGRVAWVYRHFPLASLHPTAQREAEALECAADLGGEDIFWFYTDIVYDRTPQGAALTDIDLADFAVELGLNRTEFIECLDSGKFTERVERDLQNAIDLGGRGTPHSLIISDDKIIPINGAQPYSVVKASIDSILND